MTLEWPQRVWIRWGDTWTSRELTPEDIERRRKVEEELAINQQNAFVRTTETGT